MPVCGLGAGTYPGNPGAGQPLPDHAMSQTVSPDHARTSSRRNDTYARANSTAIRAASLTTCCQSALLRRQQGADGYSNAVFRLLENLDVPRRGLVGPWRHHYPRLGEPGPAIRFLQDQLRSWDQWLKAVDTGSADEPMLTAWMQDSVPPTTNYELRAFEGDAQVHHATWDERIARDLL